MSTVKKISVALFALVACVLLAGCGGGNPAPTPLATAPTASNIQPTIPATASQPAVSGLPSATPMAILPPTVAVQTPIVAAPATTAPAQNTLPSDTPLPTEIPVAAEQNPAGDIPDTQAFVKYTSTTGGYTLQAPEGWSRAEQGANVSFSDKLDGVVVSISDAPSLPRAAQADAVLAQLKQSGRAVQVGKVQDVTLPGGPALLIEYTSNSDPNPVTGKQVRLENNRYLFWKAGKLAALTLYAPLGADNVDQWNIMARSFGWVQQ